MHWGRRPPLRRSLCLGCPRLVELQGFGGPFRLPKNSRVFEVFGGPPQNIQQKHRNSGGFFGSRLGVMLKLVICVYLRGLWVDDWENWEGGEGGIVWPGNLWIQHKLTMGNAVPFVGGALKCTRTLKTYQ